MDNGVLHKRVTVNLKDWKTMAFHTEGLQERSSFKFVIRYIKYPILYANYSEIRFRIFSHAFLLKCKKLDAATVLRWKHPAEPVRSLKLITLDKFALWTLKGQCHEIFKNKISHESNPSGPLINRLLKMVFFKLVFAKIFELKVRKIRLRAG